MQTQSLTTQKPGALTRPGTEKSLHSTSNSPRNAMNTKRKDGDDKRALLREGALMHRRGTQEFNDVLAMTTADESDIRAVYVFEAPDGTVYSAYAEDTEGYLHYLIEPEERTQDVRFFADYTEYDEYGE